MKNQVLSIEQMKRLIKLGVDTSGASMVYRLLPECFWTAEKYYLAAIVKSQEDIEAIPTFTLQDILNAMPFVVKSARRYGTITDYTLSIDASRNKEYTVFLKYEENSDYDVLEGFSSDNLLEAAYNMLCWCTENGYLNKK